MVGKLRVDVSKKFIEESLEMAEDLYGLACVNKGSKDFKKKLKAHIKLAKIYLKKMEERGVE